MTPRPDWPWPPEDFALHHPNFALRPMTPAETQAYADEYQREQIASAQSDEADGPTIEPAHAASEIEDEYAPDGSWLVTAVAVAVAAWAAVALLVTFIWWLL